MSKVAAIEFVGVARGSALENYLEMLIIWKCLLFWKLIGMLWKYIKKHQGVLEQLKYSNIISEQVFDQEVEQKLLRKAQETLEEREKTNRKLIIQLNEVSKNQLELGKLLEQGRYQVQEAEGKISKLEGSLNDYKSERGQLLEQNSKLEKFCQMLVKEKMNQPTNTRTSAESSLNRVSRGIQTVEPTEEKQLAEVKKLIQSDTVLLKAKLEVASQQEESKKEVSGKAVVSVLSEEKGSPRVAQQEEESDVISKEETGDVQDETREAKEEETSAPLASAIVGEKNVSLEFVIVQGLEDAVSQVTQAASACDIVISKLQQRVRQQHRDVIPVPQPNVTLAPYDSKVLAPSGEHLVSFKQSLQALPKSFEFHEPRPPSWYMLVSPGVPVKHSTIPLQELGNVLRQCGEALNRECKTLIKTYPDPPATPEECSTKSSNSSNEEHTNQNKKTSSPKLENQTPEIIRSDSNSNCPVALVTDIKTLDLVAKQIGIMEDSSIAAHAQHVQEKAKVFGLPREDWVKLLQLTVNRALWSTLPPEYRVGEKTFKETVALLEHNQHPGQAGVAILSNLKQRPNESPHQFHLRLSAAWHSYMEKDIDGPQYVSLLINNSLPQLQEKVNMHVNDDTSLKDALALLAKAHSQGGLKLGRRGLPVATLQEPHTNPTVKIEGPLRTSPQGICQSVSKFPGNKRWQNNSNQRNNPGSSSGRVPRQGYTFGPYVGFRDRVSFFSDTAKNQSRSQRFRSPPCQSEDVVMPMLKVIQQTLEEQHQDVRKLWTSLTELILES
ncbi:pinin-like [Emydura macquarii macquarii]|uniref:pinin-like n=1 Tax=Emydura macquarii macquarii TaxID=1129001 RepID=UPI00352B2E0B